MEYFENKLTIEDYIFLRSAVGWNNFETDQMAKVVQNSLYAVTVVEENQTIAMGRLLGDGMYYLVVDVVVKPEYQKRGIGSQIMDMLLKYVEERTPNGGRSSVQLIAEKGKEAFYISKGFKVIPHDYCGSGMRKVIRK
ncbi:MAG: GNAT family N-acetyltransferase [Lachnospiraceae bacterium]|nr:GNAT family N-acetyltransferase [Lachnospiraceae bacterium]